MFQTKYRIEQRLHIVGGEAMNFYYPEYRPWWSPLWLACGYDGTWGIIGTPYPAAFRAMLHIKNFKKMRGADPSVVPCSVVWQE